mmetsp:Transcript_13392/g.31968  ORF Transcript_13392/g.31968 Transcript_13392/m.31968 type:complete len:162 (+) Transcript_13392:207-692(+)
MAPPNSPPKPFTGELGPSQRSTTYASKFAFVDELWRPQWLKTYASKYAFIDSEFSNAVLPRKLKDVHTPTFEGKDHTTSVGTEVFGEPDSEEDAPGSAPFTWADLPDSPKPHYWQLDLMNTQQIAAAHESLGLAFNHFKSVLLVFCTHDLFFRIDYRNQHL